MKKIFTYLTILSLAVSYSPAVVLAQTASSAGSLQASGSASIASTQSADFTPVPSPTPSPTPSSIQQLIQQLPINANVNSSSSGGVAVPAPNISSVSNISSANLNQPPRVLALLRRDYRAGESVSFDVENVTANNISVKIIGPFGENIADAVIQKTQEQALTTVLINTPSSFRPGKYTVEISGPNGIISTQEFTWGVLAINTDKSIYLPNQTADIAMAVLDSQGEVVCNAGVTLQIIAPSGQETDLSTKDGTIIINPECKIHAVTDKPDYEASYQTGGTGNYSMTLTATTSNGSYSITDGFQVRNSVPFDVQRISATRIYPPDTYPVTIKIHANEDFKGKIVETVPSSFQISKASESGVLSYNEESLTPGALASLENYGIPHLRLPFNGDYPVTLGFGQQLPDPTEANWYKQYGLAGHDGIDFGLPMGTPVLAVDDGTVILAEENWIYGTTIVIQHKWGRSYYGHLSKLEVKLGERVTAGEEIGLSGATGHVTGPHLHFGIKPNNNDIGNLYFGKIDPAPFLGISTEDPALYASTYTSSSQALIWNVEIAKGTDFTIGYQYKAPDKSPYLYTAGPLQFIGTTTNIQGQAKFDVPSAGSAGSQQTGSGQVQSNLFVLGLSTSSAQLNNASNSATLSADLNTRAGSTTSGELNLSTNSSTSSAQNNSIQDTAQTPSAGSGQEQLIFKEIRLWQIAADSTSFITSGTSWTVPSDWNNSSNTIEVIGGGGGGGNGASGVIGGGGGGGGAYSAATNIPLTAGSTVTIAVGSGGGAAGSGGDTYLCNSTSNCASITGTAVVIGAKGGGGASGSANGYGGIATGGVGSTTYSGGNGGSGGTSISAGAGAGAGGSSNVGGNGGNGTSSNGGTGGQGDGTAGGAGGSGGSQGHTATGGTAGTSGTEWDSTHGSGGGGGGGGSSNFKTNAGGRGGAGASYGAGGGGGGGCNNSGCTVGAA